MPPVARRYRCREIRAEDEGRQSWRHWQPGQSRQREDDALALAATLVGALILARAVDDPELSDRILAASRARLNEAT
jgi:hypothetical protein